MRFVFQHKPAPAEARAQTAGWRQLRVWLPSLFCMIVIAIESTNTFSSENTSGWLRPVFERIFGPVSDQFWGVLHHGVRKCGHFTWYGTLCVTYLRAWLLTLARRENLALWKWRAESVLLAVLCTFSAAGLDEWHQTFIPSRTGTFSDVLIDTAGGVTFCVIVWLVFWLRPWLRRGRPAALAAVE